MCNCIEKLVAKGFVERESVYEDDNFVDKGYRIREYTRAGRVVTATNHVFNLNYCPACGEKLGQ